jgi:tetratricopeptide (TPR) repeat protein
MKTPFRLRKVSDVAPVAAVLLLREDVRAVLDACGGRSGQLPPVFAVPGGFLIKASGSGYAGGAVIRLRALADDLFLPVDAVLEPALLDDEAAALVRDRGLVFLPGGHVLAFAPQRPLRAAELLVCARTPPRGWRCLSVAPALPDRLREIVLDRPQETSELILQAGAGEIGSEAPRPPAGSAMSRATGGAEAGMGYGLVWLGRKLGLGALARLGAWLIRRGIRRSPRLSENVLGRQEAALRELLRQFREGRLEDALRHALPLNAPAGRGAQLAGDARLPVHNTRYNLRDLLFSGSGRSALWMGGGEVQAELAREYRKAAEEAAARGDWRRAAFIWGKLLNQHREAAAALARGGLHHDAAVLYLEILGDTAAAAHEFEAAGEIDRALALYRRLGDHVAAGALLRRAGENELALAEYLIAASYFARAGDFVGAGDLLRDRGGRPDLALPHYEAGWARRPGANAVACLARLLPLRAAERSPQALWKLLDEADGFFLPHGSDTSAARFYTTLAQLADEDHLAGVRDDLRDRALLGLAHKLRQQTEANPRAPNGASTLFGRSDAWHPAVVRDAAFAVRAAQKRPAPAPSLQLGRIEVRSGTVTAVCAAAESGTLFLGYEDGNWAMFDPVSECAISCRIPLPAQAKVLALESDRQGKTLVVLHAPTAHSQIIAAYRIEAYRVQRISSAPLIPVAEWMTPIAEEGGVQIIGLWQGDKLCVRRVPDFLATGEIPFFAPKEYYRRAMLRRSQANGKPWSYLQIIDWQLFYFDGQKRHRASIPGVSMTSPTWSNVHISLPHCWYAEDQIVLASFEHGRRIAWLSVRFNGDTPTVARAVHDKAEYRAVALLPQSRIAAVGAKGIDWLRRMGETLVATPGPRLDFRDAVACTYSAITQEVLVVLASGTVVRVPANR